MRNNSFIGGSIIIVIFSLLFFEKRSKEKQNNVMNKNGYEKAIFAGGCFWCVESAFEKYDGVIYAISGYSGGESEYPTYELVSSGQTGHVEAVLVLFDPKIISYEKILDIFWKEINPTDSGGQFADRGFQYTTAIFYFDETQKKLAEKSKIQLEKQKVFSSPVVTKIVPYKNFYQAEEYHQDYSKKNPIRYSYYRKGSGREKFLKEIWK